MSLDGCFFDAALGIAMFNPAGDVHGTALYMNGNLRLHAVSPNGTYGTSPQYPILTIAVPVKASLPVGARTQVTLDPSSSFWVDLLGSQYAPQITPGSVTVGGVLSISNIVPGGGLIAAGQPVTVYGTGFDPTVSVQIDGVSNISAVYLDPQTVQISAPVSFVLDGKRVILSDKAGSTVYFSYTRGVPLGHSSIAPIAATVPIFSVLQFTDAMVPVSPTATVNPNLLQAVAVQNPGLQTITVNFDFYISPTQPLAHGSVSLPPGMKYSRALSEIAGSTLPPAAFVRVRAATGVQVLGLLADLSAGDVTPVPPLAVPPGTF